MKTIQNLLSLEEAKYFIETNIKEGIYAPEDFDGMSDLELRVFATHEESRAQDAVDRGLKDE